MKNKFVILAAVIWLVVSAAVMAGANGHGSHPDEKSNGIGSSRFPDHYAGPGPVVHP